MALIGYWAFMNLQTGGEHVSSQKISALEDENEDLKKQVEDLTSQVAKLTPVSEVSSDVSVVDTKIATTTYKNQTLINELQKLIDDKVFMKLKSKGTRVGTVQNFLNLYNKTSNKIDNDYGASVVKAVSVFQKAEGLTADGQAGAGTFQKMIDWLKKQG